MRLGILVAAITSILLATGAHAQDGARAYFPVPAGTSDIDLTATFSQLEVDGSVFNSAVFTPSYRHSFDVLGDAVTFLIGLPVGAISSSIDTGFGIVDENTGPALGDLFVGGTVGLIGAPALSPMEYAQIKPGLAVSATARLFLPTGDYDSSRFVSLGGNRWSLQAGLPISYALGSSYLDPQLTTFEIMPTVQIFGDNPDAPVTHAVMSQAPLFGLEGHVTRNFNPAVWAALDAFAQVGGETSSNGVAQGDGQETLALGATLGVSLAPTVAVRLSYQEQVYSSKANNASRRFMATSAFLF